MPNQNNMMGGPHPSARAQLRNNLLHSDIGDIDVTQERPINMNESSSQDDLQVNDYSQQQQYPQQQHQQMAHQQAYNSQQQQRNQQYYTSPNQQYPQQQNQQYSQQQSQQYTQQSQQYSQQQGFLSPQQQQRFTSPQQQMNLSPQQQKPYQRMQNYRNNQNAHNNAKHQQQHQEKKAYSLNQKSISNFFKGKSHQMGFNMGKRAQRGNADHRSNRIGGGGDDDEDGGDTLLDEPDTSIMTFDDITTITYKKGDKLGMGDTTAPIIPTLVTKEGKNMNNTEYRKYMTNQKKTAYTAMAKQNKMMQSPNNNMQGINSNPRAMSLQTNQNPYLQQQQQQQQQRPNLPYQNMNNNVGGSATNGRANSLATGPPSSFNYIPGQQGTQPFSMDRGPNGPFQKQQALPIQQQGGFSQNNEQPRAMSLANNSNQNLQRFEVQKFNNNLNETQFRGPVQGYTNQNYPQNQQQQQQQQGPQDEYRTMSLQTNPLSRAQVTNGPNGYNYHNSSSSATPTPVGSEISYIGSGTSATTIHSQEQVVAPLSNSNQEEGTRILQDSQPKAKLNVLKLSDPQKKELHEKEISTEPFTQVSSGIENIIQTNRMASRPQSDDLGLRPTSLLESGLKSLNLNGSSTIGENRESTQTYTSAFSDSPNKVRSKLPAHTGLYELENGSDAHEFVTAQDLRSSVNSATVAKPAASTPSLEKIVSAGTVTDTVNSTLREMPSNVSSSNNNRVSSMSTSTGVKLNLDHEADDVDDTFDYRQQSNHGVTPSAITERDNKAHQPSELNKAPTSNIDDFLFDNTLNESYTDSVDRKIESIKITGEQLSILTQNKSLMREMTLLSSELGESIKRETMLSEKLNKIDSLNPFSETREDTSVSLSDFESELRKKSSKILELIQSLNDERLKRFIAEEQILLSEVNARPSTIELISEITELKNKLREKDSEIETLKQHIDA
ncbi:similar to Saccharomyces cerevisiae YMR124W Protein of unknown function [Maudiozyma saulgeensis]|uniref:Uncharacterized protein n=1 Tax=Maudiozyma saulgeensis TaxID=1789683 RepID=A0A1X7R1Q9_9SACH|nr:similar to Saccharomyces cerevisiae YMR124W Protein of unknown function [Kazachstania saulgeensis]